MLERYDLARVFLAAQQAGYTSCEIFAESTLHTEIHIHGRIEEVRLFRQGGISLRCFQDNTVRQFSGLAADTRTLLEWLRDGVVRTAAPPGTESGEVTDMGRGKTDETTKFLSHLARSTWNDHPSLMHPRLGYDSQIRFFEVANSQGKHDRGREEYAEVWARWALQKGSGRIPFRAERLSSSSAKLLHTFSKENPFRDSLERSFEQLNPWPAPRGEMPVWWSERAFSKLCLHFLRAFEGDLVLGNISFLMDLPLPISLGFSVQDVPDTNDLACDHEGSPRRAVPVFNGGRPRGLACNNWVAQQLNVPSTGHCRRQSFRATPTVGFWSPHVVGTQKSPHLKEKMDWGIGVGDLDVHSFNPSTGDIRMRLRDVSLVHHGEQGEAVAPIDLSLNLIDLLPTLRHFSDNPETVGLVVAKNQQRLLTEVSAPAALSDALQIPGEVPTSHYW